MSGSVAPLVSIVRVGEAEFDFGAESVDFERMTTGAGALVTFTGLVRDCAENPLEAMEIEHYPGMTERALRSIAAQAHARWELAGTLIIHRTGRLVPGARIMMVASAAKHRQNAFDSAAFLMDFLKSRAPFWKREIPRAGPAVWVDSKAADEAAIDRWSGE